MGTPFCLHTSNISHEVHVPNCCAAQCGSRMMGLPQFTPMTSTKTLHLEIIGYVMVVQFSGPDRLPDLSCLDSWDQMKTWCTRPPLIQLKTSLTSQ
ncbi:hypothetical protein AVEN_266826-1 [Araneus ventricosus]|uniref:Uncharacterized protein n=1 Tax=Araneus ventricosus TaxID=182803 RepID=A0A4Y2JAH5_ARAVE|nr:hypothetical protein AVEN_266826-1 [Araneus ventricosus]